MPVIIQGGMGVAVSHWPLAKAVSETGQLGVVSGTVLSDIFIRRLNEGDPGGHLRRALATFPYPNITTWILRKYFKEDGHSSDKRYQGTPMLTDTLVPTAGQVWPTVAAAYCEVTLAKEGHDGLVGINLLEKVQNPLHSVTLYGAMLAKVDYVLMGAGVPWQIKEILRGLACGEVTKYMVDVIREDNSTVQYPVDFDPMKYGMSPLPKTTIQPKFLAIISSDALARRLKDKVDGFVIEGWNAGGHNAPPRDRSVFNELGEPEYGAKDIPNLETIRALGLPFWLAGGYNTPAKLQEALGLGAAGIQVGSPFALSEDSGLDPEIRTEIHRLAQGGGVEVKRDAEASPTGFPINLVVLPGTLSDSVIYANRDRVCGMGYLRQPYEKPGGGIGYRCPAEPVTDYVAKGGRLEDTEGRRCLCIGLCATAGYPQLNKAGTGVEIPIVTLGKGLNFLNDFPGPYTAKDFVRYLLGEAP